MDLYSTTHSYEAECKILGCMIKVSDAYFDVESQIKPEHFKNEVYRHIFCSIRTLAAEKRGIEFGTIEECLNSNGLLEYCGGREHLIKISNLACYRNMIGEYTEIVIDKYIGRRLFDKAGDTQQIISAEDGRRNRQKLNDVQQTMLELYNDCASNSFPDRKKDVEDAFNDLISRVRSGGGIRGLSTGLKSLDEVIGGLQKKKFMVIGARPSVGKSALGIFIATEISLINGKYVLFFSSEMGIKEIIDRQFSMVSGVNQQLITTAKLNKDQENDVLCAAEALKQDKLIVEDRRMSVLEMQMYARDLMRKKPIELIVIDHLHRIKPSNEKATATEQISTIAQELAEMAKNLDVPLLVMAQFNREANKREDKRPTLIDLKQSGGIEENAHVVLALHREEVFNPDSDQKGIAELIVLKNRSGPGNMTIFLNCNMSLMRFSDQEIELPPLCDDDY
jgi:replicative DNA helicase